MRIRSFADCKVAEAEEISSAIVVGCGYEQRSRGITSLFSRLPETRIALCFQEFSTSLARQDNETYFRGNGFSLKTIGSNDPQQVQAALDQVIRDLPAHRRSVVIDISTMTRSWHGALIRQLRMGNYGDDITTLFTYNPSIFRMPPSTVPRNEFVAPVEGFAALTTPELPVAAIIGLGYEKEGALGLQQLLDPALTILFKPNGGDGDRYHDYVLKNNREILARTPPELCFDYSLDSPAQTLSNLASMVGGLTDSYRVVLASLGPKMFGLISFLLTTQFPDISVWRISSGVHGHPRNSIADLERATILKVNWQQ